MILELLIPCLGHGIKGSAEKNQCKATETFKPLKKLKGLKFLIPSSAFVSRREHHLTPPVRRDHAGHAVICLSISTAVTNTDSVLLYLCCEVTCIYLCLRDFFFLDRGSYFILFSKQVEGNLVPEDWWDDFNQNEPKSRWYLREVLWVIKTGADTTPVPDIKYDTGVHINDIQAGMRELMESGGGYDSLHTGHRSG